MKLRSGTIYYNEQAQANTRRRNTSRHPLWKVLPPEIRLMVLKELRPLADKRNPMAHWASVCKEWQYFFEPDTFKALKIRSPGPEIGLMAQIVKGYRRKLVWRISLHVEMAEYSSAEYSQPEDSKTITTNNAALAEAVTSLFAILSKWNKSESSRYVTLQLSAGSIADNHHPYKTFHRHFLRQRADNRWAFHAKRRLLGNLLDSDFQAQKLPRVPIIKKLSMARHYYRSLSGSSMEHILSSLPGLNTLSYQSWRAIDRQGHTERDAATKRILETVADTPGIRTAAFWEARSWPIHNSARYSRPVNHSLVYAAVRASYRLHRFAISHTIDAAYFFQCHNTIGETTETGGWPDLFSLALTTNIGRLRSSPVEVNNLIMRAGIAASRMPKLKIMEVWAPGVKDGFFFRYAVREDSTQLLIAATWQLQIDIEAIRPWQQVGNRHAPFPFFCDLESISPETLISPSSICSKLKMDRWLREW
ncbi:hypothetical protein LX32DRAFT_599788 [Colletotrichum zoysiae]|uniref:DUF6546 domain-containing protein n=1 Tax=Colletotrichum zoysiae TaxID=1216348 RepID=A0AAD9H7X9_9PEZI|nr:hypothetical protein LX32DRAFT_599788 [Colletotrichum zoysiae]